MVRAGLVILMMVGALHSTARANCIGEDKDHVVLARQGVTLTEGRFPVTFPAIVRQVAGAAAGPAISGRNSFPTEGVEVSVFSDDGTYPCERPLIDITTKTFHTARVDALNFPWFRGIDIVSQFLGSSGSSFSHRLFVRTDKTFIEVTPDSEMIHTNMGGFFFGSLGHGRGDGFVIWDADWTDGAHYDPHPYKATFFRWDGHVFQPAGTAGDSRKYPVTEMAPDFLGLPDGTRFDQTMPYVGTFDIIRDSQP